MANPKVKLKRSSTEGKRPTPDQVPLGELALNTYDGLLYASKDVGSGTTVVAINPFRVGAGTDSYNIYFTEGNVGVGTDDPTSALTVSGDANVTGVVTATSFVGSATNLTSLTGASLGTYGDSGSTPVITIDSNGRITGITTTSIDTGTITTRNTTTATATAGQTTFSVTYSVGYVDVFQNGVKLDSTEFTATNGTSVVLTTGAVVDDILEFVAYSQVGLSTVIPDIIGDTTPQLGGNLDLNSNDITGTGNVNLSGGGNIIINEDSKLHLEGSSGDDYNAIWKGDVENTVFVTSRFNVANIIDSNNDDTSSYWSVRHNGTTLAGSSELMRVESNGNVGVGTANPTSDGGTTLEIYDASIPTLKLNDGGDYKSLLQLRGNDLEVRGSNGNIEFYTGNADGASSTEKVRITSDGKVCIGSASDEDLEFGTDANAILQLSTASAPKLILCRDDTSVVTNDYLGIIDFHSRDGGIKRVARIGARAGGNHGSDDGPTDLVFHTMDDNTATSAEERLRITFDGKVGIGTDNPQTLQHLKSDDPTIRIQRHNQSAYGDITVDTSGKIIFKSDPGNAANGDGFSFTVNNSEKVGITSAGRVGVGTDNPSSKFEVRGDVNFAAGLLKEGANITAGKLSDNTNIDLSGGMVHLFTTAETTTSTPNLRYDASTSLDSKMSVGESITVVLIVTAAAAGYSAQLTIDGSAVTESWLGGSAPSAGGSSGYDVYTYNVIKTASATFVILANLTNFA